MCQIIDCTALDAAPMATLAHQTHQDSWTAEACAELLKSPHTISLKLERTLKNLPKKSIVEGFILGRVLGDDVEILCFAIHPLRQGEGLGSQLLQYFENRSQEKGAQTIFLEVRQENHRAISFYTLKNYDSYGMRKNYYQKPTADAVLMKKNIKV
ncbi:ribosomal protein S18-alanine N-acetyltransferase [Alphaproteobacteria bacterium]|nr:ribosomal protein S18-alanine N-acetyltransferase [Alphaproteobacteria bacterium]